MRPLPQVPLSAVADAVRGAEIRGDADVVVREVGFDSRETVPGRAVLLRAGREHRRPRLTPATRSARARSPSWSSGGSTSTFPRSASASVREAMGPMSAVVFDEPSRSLTVVGVTGTNGKTTVVHLLDAVFRTAGHRTGRSGPWGRTSAANPSPSREPHPRRPISIRLLARMRDTGITTVAMEVSSHALDLGRVGGVRFDVGRLHQPLAGPPRPSRDDGALLRGEGVAVHPGTDRSRRREPRRSVGAAAPGCRRPADHLRAGPRRRRAR